MSCSSRAIRARSRRNESRDEGLLLGLELARALAQLAHEWRRRAPEPDHQGTRVMK